MRDNRIKIGWKVEGAINDEFSEWRSAHPEFVEWTREWFEAECAHDFVGDNSDMCGGGSLKIFSTKKAAEMYGTRDAAVCSGKRPIETVYYADTSCFVSPDDADDEVESEWLDRRSDICFGIASTGGFFADAELLFASATTDGEQALTAALNSLDQLDKWSREQELAARK